MAIEIEPRLTVKPVEVNGNGNGHRNGAGEIPFELRSHRIGQAIYGEPALDRSSLVVFGVVGEAKLDEHTSAIQAIRDEIAQEKAKFANKPTSE